MSLSTHILDTTLGRPGAGVEVQLETRVGDCWTELASNVTDDNGRAKLLDGGPLRLGVYRLRFDTGAYFREQQMNGLYPYVEVVFYVENPVQHYHIPLLLTANGYTTYRGS